MRSRSNVVGLLLAPLFCLGACNALVGVEDVHLRDDPSGGGDGGASSGSGGGLGGKTSAAGSDATNAGADDGGVPGGAGEPASGGAGSGGIANGDAGSGGATAGDAGAGGMGGAGEEPDPCPALGEEKPVRGPLTLVQFAPHKEPRGHLDVSADGKNAYVTSWGSITQHFMRDTLTGKLTPKSTAWVYNGEYAVLSPSSPSLFVGGVNGTQFYRIPIAADGSITNTDAHVPPSYLSSLDAIAVGDKTIFLPSGSSIRAIQNDVYDPTNRVPGTYDGVRGLSRSGQYLYWTEYANQVQFPNGATAVGRAHFECDGTLGPREAFATGYAPWDVAACQKSGFVYVPHVAESADKPGWVDVVDLSTCKDDFSSCKPLKKLTGTEIAGLVNPSGVRVSTDCSTLYLTNLTKSAGGQLMVLSLTKPEAPELLQTFEEGKTYDGVTMTGGISAWHMTFFDGYLYVPMEFGEGVAVFKGK